jgi:hypothetical protein
MLGLMLIDTRDDRPPPPPPGRPERSWPVRPALLVVAGIFVLVISSAFSPLPAYGLMIVACVLIGRGFATLLPTSSFGLKDHRQ